MIGRWQVDLLNREYLALESGALTHRVADRIRIKSGPDKVRESTEGGVLHAGERAMRNQCSNAIVVSVGVLGDDDNERMVRFILAAGAATETWHGVQNKKLRSVADAEEWIALQYGGALIQHIKDTMLVIQDPVQLRDCKVYCPQPGGELLLADLNDQVVYEDEMCELFGILSTSMVMRRSCRILWAFGWPVRFGGLLGTQNIQLLTLQAFKTDLSAWEALSCLDPLPSEVTGLVARSIFNTTSVQQYIEVFL
jgi:hypothetical protein